MNLQQLRYARAVAETGSFIAAASRCSVTQPTLSNGVAQLERELGHLLFARTTRSVQLTAFGRDLLPAIVEVLNAQAALLGLARKLVNPDRQLIRLGVSPLIGLALVDLCIEPFRRANPGTEIVYRELNLAEMMRQLDGGQLEFVIGPVDHDAQPATGCTTVRLHEEPLVYVAKGQARNRAANVTLKDIAHETFVMVPDACGLARATRSMFQRNRLKLLEYPGEAMSYRVLQDWAEIGIGSAILPLSKVTAGSGARIVDGKSLGDDLTIAYHAVWHCSRDHGTAITAFGRYLEDVAPLILRGMT